MFFKEGYDNEKKFVSSVITMEEYFVFHDAAIKELDSYIRANINAIVCNDWGWQGSAYFNNGESLIIEVGEEFSEGGALKLLIADDVKIYKSIDCFGGYSKVYFYGNDSIRPRNVYANGVVSELQDGR